MAVGRNLTVATIEEAFMVGADFQAYEAGEISADDFILMWEIHPDSFDWITVHTG